ncbi:MAG: SUMF1/EgtB/PvdO family nonheme iron enzyme [Polyangiaceae bacterium]|nr:SUMF1/EgtB/PvdO family nonheme iron enzyme [Myxococcales bacterium]MCB9590315.1 SUMF1/EgtB/PvdO family nonheme iron enzyme [Polyangiaceae bacterium]MCB9605030.1 SUMF1/EgtB/PvdO family nonheme iron enzyme [Polyangiaceae bacterium]
MGRVPRVIRHVGVTGIALSSACLSVACSEGDTAHNGLELSGGSAGVASNGGAGGVGGASGSGGSSGAAGSSGMGASGGAGAVDAGTDAPPDTAQAPCPDDMLLIDDPSLPAPVCMDRYEAPNVEGELPLVMLNFDEAEAWCARHEKRLCFDDEWAFTCGGPEGYKYPYGDVQQPGVCNDAKTWKVYNQTLLSGWPYTFDGSGYDTLDALFSGVSQLSASAKAAADHVRELYQAEPAGSYAACVGVGGVRDLTGSVEEWTRRRDGGQSQFHGNLKGRYWADTRTCQNDIITHGDGFRFYEIGFRCCQEPQL